MSNINFYLLVEQLLNESLGSKMMGLLPIPGGLTFEECAKWAARLHKSGTVYLKSDELMGYRPAFPIIDTLFGIFRILQNNKLITSLNEDSAVNYAKELQKTDNIEDFYNTLEKTDKKKEEEKEFILAGLRGKLSNLFDNFSNYRDYNSVRLKQLVDQTQALAAEDYLNLSPYDAIMKLLKEYGGYDRNLVKNILYYPGETKFTQKSNIEGPIMGSIVEICKLMLLFYREYIVEQREKNGQPVVNAVMNALKIKNFDEFKRILETSAGKLSPEGQAGKELQKDYIRFIDGKSVFTIDPNVPAPIKMPVEPPKPAISVVNDFRNITGKSQEVYEAFLSLFNNIRKGTHPSKWGETVSKILGSGVKTGLAVGTEVARGIAGFSGHSLYGN